MSPTTLLLAPSDILAAVPESGPQPGAFPSGAEPALSDGPRVMVVEDELLVAWHMESMLEDLGVDHALSTASGEAAIELAKDFRPDVVLMDVNLGSGIDGIETARRLRLESRGLRVVFVTAYTDAATLARMQAAAPGSAVLSKPASAAHLEPLLVPPITN